MSQIAETIDIIPDKVLIYIIQNASNFTWNFLAIKIILTRLKLQMDMNNEDILPQCCAELRNLLKKSINVTSSRKDLMQILSLNETFL